MDLILSSGSTGASTFWDLLRLTFIIDEKKFLWGVASNSIQTMFNRLDMRYIFLARHTLDTPSPIEIEFC